MFCNLCGANIPDGSPRCSKCGNFFPRHLGQYSYKVVLTSFADYNAKKKTAKFLASRVPNATLTDIVKRLETLPLVIAKRVDADKAGQLSEVLTPMGARVRFVPVITGPEEKARLVADLKKSLKRSYLEGKPLPIPKSVERLETRTKTTTVKPRFILLLISILLIAVVFFMLPRYYTDFYEQQKKMRGQPVTPTSVSPVPGGDLSQPPPESADRKPPAVVIPEIATGPRNTVAEEGAVLFKQGDYEGALNKFLSALEKYPGDTNLKTNIALCYIAMGWDNLSKGNLDAARTYLNKSIDYGEMYQAYEGLGFIAEKEKNLESAEKFYVKALALNPEADEVMLALGLVYYYQEKLDESLALLKKFSARHPDDETAKYYIEKIQRENPIESGLDTRETGHFIVKYSGSEKNLVGDSLLSILEGAYSTVGSKLNYYPNHKITVILYTDKEFTATTDSPGWAGAIFDGKIRVPVKGYSGSSDVLKKMILHEYTHAVVFDLSGQDCPTWLNEGLAQIMEGASVDQADRLVKDYLSQGRKKLPLRDLAGSFTSMSADNAYLAYMMSLSATNFLITKYGESSVKAILAAIKGGKKIDEAINSVLLLSFDDFIDRWADYINR